PAVSCGIIRCARPRYSLMDCVFFSSRRRHTRSKRDWSSDVCSSDLEGEKRSFCSPYSSTCCSRSHRVTCPTICFPFKSPDSYFSKYMIHCLILLSTVIKTNFYTLYREMYSL